MNNKRTASMANLLIPGGKKLCTHNDDSWSSAVQSILHRIQKLVMPDPVGSSADLSPSVLSSSSNDPSQQASSQENTADPHETTPDSDVAPITPSSAVTSLSLPLQTASSYGRVSSSKSTPPDPYAQFEAAVGGSRLPFRQTRGVKGNYKRRPHIFAKQHQERVAKELEKALYEAFQDKGFKSDMATFREYLSYRKKLEGLEKEKVTFSIYPPVSKGSSIRFLGADETDYFERHMEKVRRSMESPKPPKPFTPSIEQLKLSRRAKDERIDRKLHPKRLPLPTKLSDSAERDVANFVRKRGVLSKKGKEQVNDQDISRLLPGQWLNDEIINFYGQMLLDRSADSEATKENKQPKYLNVHYFNTFFWTKLHDSGYEKARLAKWTKKIDIFSKDVILIPVNHRNSHWSAAAINFRRKRIESYDSMGFIRTEVYKLLRQYLDEEHKNKKKKPFDFGGWDDYIMENIPQQENGHDCGVFTCQFLETLSRGEEEFDFSQRDMPYIRKRMIWEICNARFYDIS